MKIITFKKLILTCILSFSVIVPSTAFAINPCPTNGAGEITASGDQECSTNPDTQEVTFYLAALCKSKPVAPTTSTAIDLSSCSTFFQNDAGATVNIQLGATSVLTGEFTKPDQGIYSYVYMEVDPVQSVTVTKTFSQPLVAYSSGNSGQVCWSGATSIFSWSSGQPSAGDCGIAAAASPQKTTILVNAFDGSGIASASFPISSGMTLNAFLLTSAKRLGTGIIDSMGDVDRLGGYFQKDYVVGRELTSIIVNYNNQQGTSLTTDSNSGQTMMENFGAGPFDFSLTLQ
jgi:hypothetical protein